MARTKAQPSPLPLSLRDRLTICCRITWINAWRYWWKTHRPLGTGTTFPSIVWFDMVMNDRIPPSLDIFFARMIKADIVCFLLYHTPESSVYSWIMTKLVTIIMKNTHNHDLNSFVMQFKPWTCYQKRLGKPVSEWRQGEATRSTPNSQTHLFIHALTSTVV